jgi:hypothetical protein
MNGQKELTDWDTLTESQKTGIIDALEEIEEGVSTPFFLRS